MISHDFKIFAESVTYTCTTRAVVLLVNAYLSLLVSIA